MTKLTDEQAEKIGQSCHDAFDGNLVVGSFAAELIGESYPVSKAMCAIIFKTYTNVDLGRKFEQWIKESSR